MEIVDIPSQVSRALKYSVRSPSSLLTSYCASVLAMGVCFDLVYGFFYARIYNAKDVRYGPAFWIGMAVLAGAVPLLFCLISVVRARKLCTPFGGDRYGIAIAPFEVFSLDPDTLGTATKLQAMDTVMSQFFTAAQEIIAQEAWEKQFDFRFLPANVRLRSGAEALACRQKLRATLLIWGAVIQQSNAPLKTVLHLLGTEIDLTMTGPLDPFMPIPFLKFCALSAAGYQQRAGGHFETARELFVLARAPAAELDKQANSSTSVGIVDGCIREMDEHLKGELQAAVAH